MTYVGHHFLVLVSTKGVVCFCMVCCSWLPSGVTGGGRGAECPRGAFHREIFADLPGKDRQGKTEMGEEKKENCKREGGNEG